MEPINLPFTSFRRTLAMDDDLIAGTARHVAGQEEEGIGRVTGDAETMVVRIADREASDVGFLGNAAW